MSTSRRAERDGFIPSADPHGLPDVGLVAIHQRRGSCQLDVRAPESVQSLCVDLDRELHRNEPPAANAAGADVRSPMLATVASPRGVELLIDDGAGVGCTDDITTKPFFRAASTSSRTLSRSAMSRTFEPRELRVIGGRSDAVVGGVSTRIFTRLPTSERALRWARPIREGGIPRPTRPRSGQPAHARAVRREGGKPSRRRHLSPMSPPMATISYCRRRRR